MFATAAQHQEASMAHVSRLTQQIRSLLQSRRVASLGTIASDGGALVSMVPFAVEPKLRCLVIHVSQLAAHTRNLETSPRVSVLVMQAEVPGEPVHALPRVSIDGLASELEPQSPPWLACRTAYLRRFPDAELMTQLPDFKFFAIEVSGARQVAGFGTARSIDAEELRLALEAPPEGDAS
jgi:putative heme iron utilization protein